MQASLSSAIATHRHAAGHDFTTLLGGEGLAVIAAGLVGTPATMMQSPTMGVEAFVPRKTA